MSIGMQLLGLCGSQREGSSNTRLLHAAARLLPDGVSLQLENALAELPHFSPDLPVDAPPQLAAFIARMRDADGLIVSSPVYAGGYPGTLKNALDWLVGTDAFVEKPFMLLCTSSRMFEVQESLAKVLRTMSGRHVVEATTVVLLMGREMGVDEILHDAVMASALRTGLDRFVSAIRA